MIGGYIGLGIDECRKFLNGDAWMSAVTSCTTPVTTPRAAIGMCRTASACAARARRPGRT